MRGHKEATQKLFFADDGSSKAAFSVALNKQLKMYYILFITNLRIKDL